MKIGYIRLSRSGPTREEQEAALAAAGVDLALDAALYLDPAPKRANQVASFEARREATRALRPGDVLVIYSAPRLGNTEAEIREAAAAVAAAGAALFDCAAGQEIRHHPDAGRLIEWAKAGAALAAQERLAKSRAGIKRRGPTADALTGEKRRKAALLWPDTSRSVREIAAEVGVSPRTLYRHMPKRRNEA